MRNSAFSSIKVFSGPACKWKGGRVEAFGIPGYQSAAAESSQIEVNHGLGSGFPFLKIFDKETFLVNVLFLAIALMVVVVMMMI